MGNSLVELSNELAGAVEQAGRAVVAVNARPRISSSGVHWRPGVIVTAEHAVKRDEEITVTLADGRTAAATLAGRDPGTDLATLKVEDAQVPLADFDGDESLRAGNVVLAVGRSAETGVNATMGVVSAVYGSWRTWRGGLIDRYIRLDVTLYPGSSGGAVVNAKGQVLGIATSGLSRIAGLAIPNSTVSRAVDELLAKGHVSRGYLGVGLHPVSLPAHLTNQLRLAEPNGLIVVMVEPNGPAERAGLLIGDILLALDGKPIQDTDDVLAALGGEVVGTVVKASILRGGTPAELSIAVGERPRRGELK